MTNMICSIDGCEARATIRGFCPKHYQRFRKHGDPLMVLPSANATGRPKGSYKYSDEHLLSLCKQDETQIEFECRTGIGIMTVVRRFGSFSNYKKRAATGTADLTSRPSMEPTRQQYQLVPPHNNLLSNADVQQSKNASPGVPKGNRGKNQFRKESYLNVKTFQR